MSEPIFILLLMTVVSLGCVPPRDTLHFKFATRRDDDKVDVHFTHSGAIVSIHSPVGISHVAIERTSRKWPDVVILRLYLRGLENLKVTNGPVAIEASVPSHGETYSDRPVRVWTADREDLSLDSASPHWMEVRMLDHDGKPANSNPLIEGYFEVRLPQTLFVGNPQSITISWIDFFR